MLMPGRLSKPIQITSNPISSIPESSTLHKYFKLQDTGAIRLVYNTRHLIKAKQYNQTVSVSPVSGPLPVIMR